MATTPLLAGVAGEYFVAAELSRRGFIASITLRNTWGIDIVATNSDATRTVTIQCKTSQGTQKKYILSDKAEDFSSPTHFYVFVDLVGLNEQPKYHIVPSSVVSNRVKTGHSNWLNSPGKNGRKRKDSTIRTFSDVNDEYLNKWELLGF